jgi:hypothetical protein
MPAFVRAFLLWSRLRQPDILVKMLAKSLILTVLTSSALCAADPWVGVWKMNPAKMQEWPHHLVSQVLTIQKFDAGYRFSYDLQVLNSGHQQVHNFAGLDGKKIPLEAAKDRRYKLSRATDRELVAESPQSGAFKTVLARNGQTMTTYVKDTKTGQWTDPVVFDKSN